MKRILSSLFAGTNKREKSAMKLKFLGLNTWKTTIKTLKRDGTNWFCWSDWICLHLFDHLLFTKMLLYFSIWKIHKIHRITEPAEYRKSIKIHASVANCLKIYCQNFYMFRKWVFLESFQPLYFSVRGFIIFDFLNSTGYGFMYYIKFIWVGVRS